MVDHMLIKLGKYLRILGYDAAWEKNLRTHELILLANHEGRIFLTRNTKLNYQYPQPARVLVVNSADPVQQLSSVIAMTGLDPYRGLFSRCVRCNVPLCAVADKREIGSSVHPNVYLRHDIFFRCPCCGTVFWHGSHVANTCAKLGLKLPGEK